MRAITTLFAIALIGCSSNDEAQRSGGSGATGAVAGAAGSAGTGGTVGGAGSGGSGGTAGSSGSAGQTFGNPIAGVAGLEKLPQTFGRIEGPLWFAGALYFSDIPQNQILRLDATDQLSVFRDPSGNSNGLGVDPQGLLLACEMSNHRVTRTLSNGSIDIVASGWQSYSFNAPNDLAVRSDGTVYFTDPGFDYPSSNGPGFQGVYRVDPTGALSLVTQEFDKPNGIAVSIDEHTLYVDDTFAAVVRGFAINPDGSASPSQPFVTTQALADGMCIDDAGNVYVTTLPGVQVFDRNGALIGSLSTGEAASNCAFGGADRRTLYVTAGTSLYRAQLNVPGKPF